MNIFLIILLAVIVIISILISIYVYYNRESTSSTTLFTKVTIAILAAFIFIILEILKPVTVDKQSVKILVLRNESQIETRDFSEKLLRINALQNGYLLLNEVNLFSKKIEENKNKESLALDLVENTFWTWMSKNYHLHWQINNTYFSGISGGGGNIEKAENSAEEISKFELDELVKNLSDNYFEISPARFWGVSLPQNTEVTFLKRDSHERTILLKNRNIKFKVSIFRLGNSGLTYTTLGEAIKKSLLKYYPETESMYSNNIIIKFTCDYSRWLKGSPETLQQSQWVKEIMHNFYKEFEWDELRPDLERVYSL